MADTQAPTLRCECGETHLTIAYRVPLYLYVTDGQIDRAVVVDDPKSMLGGVARCLTCDRFWLLDETPDFPAWPAWKVES